MYIVMFLFILGGVFMILYNEECLKPKISEEDRAKLYELEKMEDQYGFIKEKKEKIAKLKEENKKYKMHFNKLG